MYREQGCMNERRHRRVSQAAAVAMTVALAAACGGNDGGGAQEPAPAAESPREGSAMVPESRWVEIEHIFDRRRPMVSRCFSEAIDEGELSDGDRGFVTIGLSITEEGRATNLRVLKTDLDSSLLHSCITSRVKQWNFGSLPRTVEYSYSYQFETL